MALFLGPPSFLLLGVRTVSRNNCILHASIQKLGRALGNIMFSKLTQI